MFVSFEEAVQIARNNIARHRAAMAELDTTIRPKKASLSSRPTITVKEIVGTLHVSSKARFAKQLSHDEEVARDKRRFCKWNGGRKAKSFSRATIRGTAFIN